MPAEVHRGPVDHHHAAERDIFWAAVASHLARHWWRRHPANAIGHLARPILASYARKEPAKLIVGAAAAGALIVLTRPWRWLSPAAAVTAAVKTSDVADVVTTLIQHASAAARKQP